MIDGIGFDELLTFLRGSPFFKGFESQDLAPLLTDRDLLIENY